MPYTVDKAVAWDTMCPLGSGGEGKVFRGVVRASALPAAASPSASTPPTRASAAAPPSTPSTWPAWARQGRPVAVKVLNAGRKPVEAQMLRRLPRHDGIVPPPLEGRTAAGNITLTYPLYTKDLFSVAEAGPVAEDYVASVCVQVLHALHHCHAHGVSHCDVKLENVLVADGGSHAATTPPRVVVADFGLCVESDDHRVAAAKGSPHYMPPEAYGAAPYDGRAADVWAVGVMAAFLLTQEGVTWHHGNVVFPSAHLLSRLSPAAQDFLRHVMVLDGSRRPTIANVLQHEFLATAEAAYATRSCSGSGDVDVHVGVDVDVDVDVGAGVGCGSGEGCATPTPHPR